jgi:hypothetical protein
MLMFPEWSKVSRTLSAEAFIPHETYLCTHMPKARQIVVDVPQTNMNRFRISRVGIKNHNACMKLDVLKLLGRFDQAC